MKLDVKFTEQATSFKTEFGEVHNISDGGFERGYAEGETVGYSKGYTEGETKGKAEGIEQGYEKGVTVDNPIYYKNNLKDIWNGVAFPQPTDLMIRLYEQPTGDNMNAFLKAKNLNSVKFIADNIGGAWRFSQSFRESDVRIVDLTESSRQINDIHYMFFQCQNLVSVFGALDLTNCTTTGAGVNYAFFAGALKDIEFVPNTIYVPLRFTSANLTEASKESIINGLADLTGGTAQTITLNGVGAKLTAEQKARISAKNWTLAY